MDNLSTVPFLTSEMIEGQALQDLLRYQRQSGVPLKFPIYPDELIQTLWGVEVRYEDNVRDEANDAVLACFDSTNKCVYLNTQMRANEGQVSYSLAHEAGHISLHDFLTRLAAAGTAFCSPSPLLTDHGKNSLEIHADLYASALLMPKDAMLEAVARCEMDQQGLDLMKFGKPLRDLFGVSHQALEIRLTQLGIQTHSGFYKTALRKKTVNIRELDALEEERAGWTMT